MPTPTILIPTIVTPKANTNWSTWSVQSADWLMARLASSAVQNDEVSFDFYADAGTYDIVLFHRKGSAQGIYTVKIDGVDVGTVDGYAASAVSSRTVISSVALTAATHTLRIVMATKNASSSAYNGQINKVGFFRTGA